jgi:hypothetical protein
MYNGTVTGSRGASARRRARQRGRFVNRALRWEGDGDDADQISREMLVIRNRKEVL